ncbi:hypothetical protein Hamer_G000672 [Homarus americanus]|uniref:Uncharacterized protein n=1 Tax=Homarus americanus TaxID=6706 RepID=A0A8J5N231_HOMAM|nr:hypothetical protein Hamer_G000672 [Homarus americanus]
MLQQLLGSALVAVQVLLSRDRARTRRNGEAGSVRSEVVAFLARIRFLAMTEEKFIHQVLPIGVLKCQESDAVLKVMGGIDGATQPLVAPCTNREERKQ